jgi:hypothetical protein
MESAMETAVAPITTLRVVAFIFGASLTGPQQAAEVAGRSQLGHTFDVKK